MQPPFIKADQLPHRGVLKSLRWAAFDSFIFLIGQLVMATKQNIYSDEFLASVMSSDTFSDFWSFDDHNFKHFHHKMLNVYSKSSSMAWLGWKIKHILISFPGKHLSNSWLTLVLQPEICFCNLYLAVIPPDKWHPVSQLTYGKMFHVSSHIKWGQTSLSLEADA